MTEYIYDEDGKITSETLQNGTLIVKVVPIKGEEIVRCRDCAHLNIIGECPCGCWALENLNGFCAWGERKGATND